MDAPNYFISTLEGNMHKRMLTLPLVLFQCYPQYKMAQILFMGLWKKDKKWKEKKISIQKDIGSIGKNSNRPINCILNIIKFHTYWKLFICFS